MNLIRLQLHNVFTHEDSTLSLGEGFSLIQGQNGAGKSSLFEAINYALWGYTIRWKKTGDEIVRRGQKEGWVLLDFKGQDGEVYRIKRGRSNVGGQRSRSILELSRQSKDGDFEIVLGKTDSEVLEKLKDIVGIPFSIFRNSILFGQDDNNKFVNVADTERKELLSTLLSFGRLDLASKKVKERKSRVDNDLQVIYTKISLLDEELLGETEEEIVEQIKATNKVTKIKVRFLERAKESSNKAAAEKTIFVERMRRYSELDRVVVRTTQKLEVAKSNIRGGSQERIKEKVESEIEIVEATEERLKEIEIGLDTLGDEKAEIGGRTALLREQIEALEAGECPKCGRETEKDGEDIVERKQTHREAALQDQRVNREIEKLKQERGDVRDGRDESREALKELNIILKSFESLRGLQIVLDERTMERDIFSEEFFPDGEDIKHYFDDQLSLLSDEVDKHNETIGDFEGQLRVERDSLRDFEKLLEQTKKLAVMQEERERLLDEQSLIEKLDQIFGRTGVRHRIVELVLPELEKLTNEYLSFIDDTGTYVEFSGTKEIKSGESRDALTVNVFRDGKKSQYEDYSGGEQKRILIASSLALSEIVAHQYSIDFLLVDELFGALDSIGKSRVCHLLERLRKRFKTILVISHDDLVKDAFDDVITITKGRGISSIEVEEW